MIYKAGSLSLAPAVDLPNQVLLTSPEETVFEACESSLPGMFAKGDLLLYPSSDNHWLTAETWSVEQSHEPTESQFPVMPPIEAPMVYKPEYDGKRKLVDLPEGQLAEVLSIEVQEDGVLLNCNEKPNLEVPACKKRKFKRSKTAEEKAARIRARNRRAQQAFRSRQKALTQARNQTLQSLQEKLAASKLANNKLQKTVKDLMVKIKILQESQSQVHEGEGAPDSLCRENSNSSERSGVLSMLTKMIPPAAVHELMADPGTQSGLI